MALQSLFSFDHIATADLLALPDVISVGPGCAISGFEGRDNSGCLITTDNISGLSNKGFNFAIQHHQDVTIGAWVVIEQVPGNNAILWVYGSPTITAPAGSEDKNIVLSPAPDGSIRIWGGNPAFPFGGAAFIVGSASGILTYGPGEVHYIEMRINNGVNTGTVTVRVDGLPAIDVTPINTAVLGESQTSHIMLGNPAGSTRTKYDDIYVNTGFDNGDGWLGLKGVIQVDGKLVDPLAGAGEVTQWTPSNPSGVNFSNVNENVANLTTFNTATAIGLIDLYKVEDVTYVPIAVQVDLYMRKTTSGPSSVSPTLRAALGGPNFVAPLIPLTTIFKYHKKAYTTSPAGGAWTMAGFNALQVGVTKAE